MDVKQNQTNDKNKNIVKIYTKKKTKIKQSKEKQYFIWKDTSFLWTILILFIAFFIVISFLDVKWLTTLHSYSINIIFGMFSILFYVLMLLFCLKKLFNWKNTYSLKNIFHFSLWRLSLLFLGIIIFGSTIYFVAIKQYNYSFKNAFSVLFKSWFETFKKGNNPLLPNKYNAGIVGTFLYGLISMVGAQSGIVLSFIFSSFILATFFSFFFVSDLRFKTLSLNKEKRNKAKNEISKNIKIIKNKMKTNIYTNIFEFTDKTDEKEKIQILTNEQNVERNISDEISFTKKTIEHVEDLQYPIKDKLEETNISSINLQPNEISQNIPNGFTSAKSENIINAEDKKEEEEEKQIVYDDSPFYTTTFDEINIIPSEHNSNEFENELDKTSEQYISKTINIESLKKFENEIKKPIELEKQKENIEISKKEELENQNSLTKTFEINTENIHKKRYSIIDDEEDLF